MARRLAASPGAASASTHSGKLLLRMSPDLHARLAHEAEREGVSLNQLITSRLEGSLRPSPRAGGPRVEPVAAPPVRPERPARLASVALGVNLVVVVLAGAVAVVLLVLAIADLT